MHNLDFLFIKDIGRITQERKFVVKIDELLIFVLT